MKKISSCIFSVAKDYRTMTSRWQGAPYFRRYGRELVSKPAISSKRSWGGYRGKTRNGFLNDGALSLTQNRRNVGLVVVRFMGILDWSSKEPKTRKYN